MVKNCEQLFISKGTIRAEESEIAKRIHVLIPAGNAQFLATLF